ncbi:hypothetical protein BP6252_01670 [Coleophoma cylindrospora]|uniref:Amidohydrolase-related domain-containing protein n=1 Tax=Coleophoma cylindrospora TaxID=1849047 RepID=A0A3D8SV25_9HELO|nr:hypothetical protein BP6252_01670 [Coleophoma cylindrospora]
MIPLITLEEHYISPKVTETSSEARELYAKFPAQILSKLECLGDERIQDLDKGNVALQVISHGPGEISPSVCAAANDGLASAISKNPGRLAGFATIPMGEPAVAAEELERCVKKLGFVGALVDNHLNGQFFDDERFWSVFEKAQELNVPIYIHPCFASDPMLEHYKGNYSDPVAISLSAFGWGWHTDTGLHILRLYASGLFDRFPKLKIVIGHMGEMLPFQIERIFAIAERWGRERSLREVWTSNIWITTSGMFSLAPLACLLKTTSIEHVLYSVDYPFSANEKGLKFFEEIEKSGLIAGKDLEMFAYRNAESLLGVKARSS